MTPADRHPEPLGTWLSSGFGRDAAEAWRSWRFTIAQARAWRAVGVDDGLEAAQWTAAGAAPPAVRGWRVAGFAATEAIRWHEFGFGLADAVRHRAAGRDPATAHEQVERARHAERSAFLRQVGPVGRFRAAGVPGHIVQSYIVGGWDDDEALAWAVHHIVAGDAQVWRMLGVGPDEARRLAQRGATPTSVVRRWWRAGIPFDEVAAWLATGLSADEAAALRSRGVTAEEASSRPAGGDEDEPD